MAGQSSGVEVIVVGAGLMGTGIAHAFAVSGFSTALIDVDSKALEKARHAIQAILDEGVRRAKISEGEARSASDRLTTGASLSDAVDPSATELVVETVSEALPLKITVVQEADSLLAPASMIATNTSALSVTEIAAATERPERVIGMHFFNPVHKMRLVEVVKGLATSTEIVTAATGWVERIGKKSIVVEESPGLLTSRISALLGNEAMYMLAEGLASAEDIDAGLRGAFNHPMGPLELGDLTGWDTRLAVLEYLHRTLGEKYRPCPLIIKLVKAGRLGRKSGHGVYRYENGNRVPDSGMRRA